MIKPISRGKGGKGCNVCYKKGGSGTWSTISLSLTFPPKNPGNYKLDNKVCFLSINANFLASAPKQIFNLWHFLTCWKCQICQHVRKRLSFGSPPLCHHVWEGTRYSLRCTNVHHCLWYIDRFSCITPLQMSDTMNRQNVQKDEKRVRYIWGKYTLGPWYWNESIGQYWKKKSVFHFQVLRLLKCTILSCSGPIQYPRIGRNW